MLMNRVGDRHGGREEEKANIKKTVIKEIMTFAITWIEIEPVIQN